MKKVPKTDLHNHGTFSCTKKYLKDHEIVLHYNNITDIDSLNSFIRSNIKPLIDNSDTLPMLLNGNFDNCVSSGVTFVTPSIDYKTCINLFDSNIDLFITFLQTFQYKDLSISWTLGISRSSYLPIHKDLILKMIKTSFFTAIDLYDVENNPSNEVFIPFYDLANAIGVRTKVHAGEQLGPDYILDCINDFNPKEIQHGIRIIEDKKIMPLAKEKGIIFNVCPTSNIILHYAKSIKEHPIKAMYDNGLLITLATDDLLFFNSDINNEYLKLFNSGILSAIELNDIRKNGLQVARYYQK